MSPAPGLCNPGGMDDERVNRGRNTQHNKKEGDDMKKVFIYKAHSVKDVQDHQDHGMSAALDRKGAAAMCPWAAVIVPACGGWQCFESREEAAVWKRQN